LRSAARPTRVGSSTSSRFARDQPARRAPLAPSQIHQRIAERAPHPPGFDHEAPPCGCLQRLGARDPVPALSGGLDREVELHGREPRRNRVAGIQAAFRRHRQRRVGASAGGLDRAARDLPLCARHLEARLVEERRQRERVEIPTPQRPVWQGTSEPVLQEGAQQGILERTRRERVGAALGRDRCGRNLLATGEDPQRQHRCGAPRFPSRQDACSPSGRDRRRHPAEAQWARTRMTPS
jgi:hypothetical protein